MIDTRYYRYLSQFFNKSVIAEIADTGKCDFIAYVLKESGYFNRYNKPISFSNLFEDVYSFLFNNYRCEYIYKNAIANKILLGRHSLKTATLLNEFRVGNSKADIVILNGTSWVYEIKSEFDTFERLDSQLDAYSKLFDKIFVITHQSQLPKLLCYLSDSVGIIILTQHYTLKTIREAKPNPEKKDTDIIFDSLRQSEYCNIIKKEFGFIPQVPNTRLYQECKKLFINLSANRAHEYMINVLQQRSSNDQLKEFINEIPHSLKLLSIISNLSSRQRAAFLKCLKREYKLN